jgi:hypothetical protein
MSIIVPRMGRYHPAEPCVAGGQVLERRQRPQRRALAHISRARIDASGWSYVVTTKVIAMRSGRILWERPRRKGSIRAASLSRPGLQLTRHSPHCTLVKAVDTTP